MNLTKRLFQLCFELGVKAALVVSDEPALSLFLIGLFLWAAVKSQTPLSEVSFASITTDFLSGLLNCFLLNHLCESTVT